MNSDKSSTTEEKKYLEMMKKMCKNTNEIIEISENTTKELLKQNEIIKNISNNLDDIDYELKKSDLVVKRMSSWWEIIISKFRSSPKKTVDKMQEFDINIVAQNTAQNTTQNTPVQGNAPEPGNLPSGGFNWLYLNPSKQPEPGNLPSGGNFPGQNQPYTGPKL